MLNIVIFADKPKRGAQVQKKYFRTTTADKLKLKFDYAGKIKKERFFTSRTHDYWWLKSASEEVKRLKINDKTILTIADLYFKIEKGQTVHLFPMNEVSSVKYIHQKTILPLIFGGISSPLFFVSLLKSGIFNNWFALILGIFTAVFLVLGFQGKKRIEVITAGKSYYFECFESGFIRGNIEAINQRL